jgi:hypothetical protein
MDHKEFKDILSKNHLTHPKDVALMPINWDESSGSPFYYSNLTSKISSALKTADVQHEIVTVSEDPLFVEARSDELLLPLLFIGPAIFNDQAAITIYLNVISSYLHDKFTRMKKFRNVKMTMLKTDGKSVDFLNYNGPVDGLKEITKWKKLDK